MGFLVAPCAGAWVEIPVIPDSDSVVEQSLPVRERGLKYYTDLMYRFCIGSLPVRERGLKFRSSLESLSGLPGRSLCGSVG